MDKDPEITKKVPLYQQLLQSIKADIAQGKYKNGDKLPTEKELCEGYSISRATVRRALIELEQEELVVTRQGSGIYVSPHIFEQSLQKFYSFSQEMRRQGKQPSNQILSFKKLAAAPAIVKQMNLQTASEVIRIIRLRLADGEVYFYETTYLPAARMEGFSQEIFEDHDLYEIMQQRYKISLGNATETFKPTLTSPLIASYLGIKTQQPCMFLTRRTHDIAGQLVEYTESIGRGDKWEFSIELKNNN